MSLIPLRRVITLFNVAAKRDATPFRHYTNSSKMVAEQKEKPLTGYRKYAEQFKNKPGSYMTSFAILHEATAIAPFPFIYLALDASSAKIPFPENLVSEGNRFINKARVYYGYEPLEADNRVMTNLVTTYCIVKASTMLSNIGFVLNSTFHIGSITDSYCGLSSNDALFCRASYWAHGSFCTQKVLINNCADLFLI
jgi:hypothetical protein